MTASERMKTLNERMRTDPFLKGKVLAGQRRARQGSEYRKRQSKAMRERWLDPDTGDRLRVAAKDHCQRINSDPEIRSRQWNGRRSAPVPEDYEILYRELRRKVGAREALRIVREEATRALLRRAP